MAQHTGAELMPGRTRKSQPLSDDSWGFELIIICGG
jgi:hypothetical protein